MFGPPGLESGYAMTWRNEAMSSIWQLRMNSPSALYTLRVSTGNTPSPGNHVPCYK